ncbi:hypothetical protein M9434_001733 [Picochlorum sp. BPE23]|nr:hypothetical protein M9434_001733 [Picochlorum sp. BPE23]
MSVVRKRRTWRGGIDHHQNDGGEDDCPSRSLQHDASVTTDSEINSYPVTVVDDEDSDSDEDVVSSRLPFSLNLMDIFTLPMSPSKAYDDAIERKKKNTNEKSLEDHVESFKREMAASCPELQDTLLATGELLDDGMISRWVTARGDAALKSLQEHAAWRMDFVGENPYGVHEASIQEILDAHVMFLQGTDIHGYPVLLFLAKRYDAARFSNVISPCMVYAMDGALLSADKPEKKRIKVIFDVSSVNRKNVSIEFLESIFSILQTHYPNCLHTLYFVDAPFLFWAIWGCVRAFLSVETRNKIQFVSKSSKELLVDVGPDVLPDVYGGSGPWRPVQHSVQVVRHGGHMQQHSGTAAGSIDNNDESYVYTQIVTPIFSVRSVMFWICFIGATCIWILFKI